jgi:autotransporter-associated beta strand protein
MKTKLLILLTAVNTYAGSATWNLNPGSNNWNTATNWTPATVPNSTTDAATFGASNTTSVLTSNDVDLASIVFTVGAPSYTIDTGRLILTFWGEGVRDDSGVPQRFTGNFIFNGNSSAGDGGFSNASVVFNDNSTAANGIFTTMAGGHVAFYDTASAGNATFNISGSGISLDMWGGTLSNATLTLKGGVPSDLIARIQFSSTADHATLIANGTLAPGMATNVVLFQFGATAGEATLIANPTTVVGGTGGKVEFTAGGTAGDSNITVNGAAIPGDNAEGVLAVLGGNSATAANATIVATGGSNGGNGGLVQFLPSTQGGTCRIELLGNSRLDMDPHRDLDLTIGSLEGEGTVTVSGRAGGNTLIIGSNNLSTTFSGNIEDGLLVGGLAKIGTGTLTLSGANTYTGGTTVSSGILLVSNVNGSGTGAGAASVNAGTLGGSGIIAGTVVVGTNTGVQAFLAPSKGTKRPATLAIQGALTLNDDSTYLSKLDTKHRVSDQVLAQGVTIDNGAKFSLRASGTTRLPLGQVFTVISNTAASTISGCFHNLADGAIVTVNDNHLQASYSGGDGNDLTLTVVP